MSKPAERLQQARQQAARELKWPVTDPRVCQLAALLVAHEAVQIKMLSGHSFSIPDLLSLDAALKEARAQNPYADVEPLEVHVVKSATALCPKCRAEMESEPDAPPAEPLRFGPMVKRSPDNIPAVAQAVAAQTARPATDPDGGVAVAPAPAPKPAPALTAAQRSESFHSGGFCKNSPAGGGEPMGIQQFAGGYNAPDNPSIPPRWPSPVR
jgi:hypothetical protein